MQPRCPLRVPQVRPAKNRLHRPKARNSTQGVDTGHLKAARAVEMLVDRFGGGLSALGSARPNHRPEAPGLSPAPAGPSSRSNTPISRSRRPPTPALASLSRSLERAGRAAAAGRGSAGTCGSRPTGPGRPPSSAPPAAHRCAHPAAPAATTRPRPRSAHAVSRSVPLLIADH